MTKEQLKFLSDYIDMLVDNIYNHTHEPQPTGGLADLIKEKDNG